MLPKLPEIVLPDFVTALVTRVPMYDGTLVTGGGELPPLVVHRPLQLDGGVAVGRPRMFCAKPLNASGAMPPDSVSRVHQLLLQKVSCVVGPAAATEPTPTAKIPDSGSANTIACLLESDDGL